MEFPHPRLSDILNADRHVIEPDTVPGHPGVWHEPVDGPVTIAQNAAATGWAPTLWPRTPEWLPPSQRVPAWAAVKTEATGQMGDRTDRAHG